MRGRRNLQVAMLAFIDLQDAIKTAERKLADG